MTCRLYCSTLSARGSGAFVDVQRPASSAQLDTCNRGLANPIRASNPRIKTGRRILCTARAGARQANSPVSVCSPCSKHSLRPRRPANSEATAVTSPLRMTATYCLRQCSCSMEAARHLSHSSQLGSGIRRLGRIGPVEGSLAHGDLPCVHLLPDVKLTCHVQVEGSVQRSWSLMTSSLVQPPVCKGMGAHCYR